MGIAKGLSKQALYVWDDDNNKWIPWTGAITTGDIEIGAVEIKDGVSDNRATVTESGDLGVVPVDTVPDSLARINPPITYYYAGDTLVQIKQIAQAKDYYKAFRYDENSRLIEETKWVKTTTSTSTSSSTSTSTTTTA